MTRQTIQIRNIEQTTSPKTGKVYWKIDAVQGNMNLFDEALATKIISQGVPGNFDVDIKETGQWKNITTVFGDSDGTTSEVITNTTKVRCVGIYNRPLIEIVEILNNLDTIATQIFPKGENYDSVAWLRQ